MKQGIFMPSKSNYQKSINKFGRRKNWLKKSVLNKIFPKTSEQYPIQAFRPCIYWLYGVLFLFSKFEQNKK